MSALLALALLLATPPTATVQPASQDVRRVAAHGKAHITILARGQNAFVGRLELAPGAQVPTHRDATEEYIHVLEGSGTLTIDGKAHAVGPGSTIFMPANAEVSYTNGDAKMVALQVFAGPAPADKYAHWKPAE